MAGTEVWFESGLSCAFGANTARQLLGVVEASLPVGATLDGVRPHQEVCYRLAGYDGNVEPPEEALTSENRSVTTPVVAPRVVASPSVAFVGSSSVVMSSELNPENTSTRYDFQYVRDAAYSGDPACKAFAKACPQLAETAAAQSSSYGPIAAVLEATGLQPASRYHYRLVAVNENGEAAVNGGGGALPEGTFETGPAPVPVAVTGAYSSLGATSVTLTGSVDPDGQHATYAFELGVENGPQTQYGTLLSGPVNAGTVPVEEALGVSGLQPGTTYAYRIKIESGYGFSYGAPATFTTLGLPEVLASPPAQAMLAVPQIAFPAAVLPSLPTSTAKALTNEKLARALKACGRDRPGKRRAACQRQAHRKYKQAK